MLNKIIFRASVLAVHFMSTMRKSTQYNCGAFMSIIGRHINYKCIIATNNFMYIITTFRPYNMEVNCLMLHLHDR